MTVEENRSFNVPPPSQLPPYSSLRHHCAQKTSGFMSIINVNKLWQFKLETGMHKTSPKLDPLDFTLWFSAFLIQNSNFRPQKLSRRSRKYIYIYRFSLSDRATLTYEGWSLAKSEFDEKCFSSKSVNICNFWLQAFVSWQFWAKFETLLRSPLKDYWDLCCLGKTTEILMRFHVWFFFPMGKVICTRLHASMKRLKAAHYEEGCVLLTSVEERSQGQPAI